MDSGNSGSLHSSSGGDEEYDSRAAFSTFMNSLSPSHLRPISTASPPPPPLPFDPLSNYIQLLNPSTPWPRPSSMRSDPDPSSSHATFNPIIFQPTAASVSESNDRVEAAQTQHAAARNPRKRSRASRRDHTTVLATDTTNFRAMVQEFTGIPTTPFNGGPSFSRTRLDLLGTRSAAFEAAAAPHLHRPFVARNPNSLTSLLQSNPRFLLSKPQDQDSFGIPSSSEFDDFDLSIHENHASTILSELPNLVSPDQIKTAAVVVGAGYGISDGKAAAFRGGEDCEER